MKKILKALLSLVLVFGLVASFVVFSKADDIVTDANIVVEGAQVRTGSEDVRGMRFVATVKDYVVPAGKTIKNYGFVIALGSATADENFVIGGTVNGRKVSSATLEELSDVDEKQFQLTIFGIPESAYGQDLSARAFVILDDDSYVYGAESSVRNLVNIIIQAVEEGELTGNTWAEAVVTTVSNTYKQYFLDNLGSFYVNNSVNESNPAKLYKAFAKDFNAFKGADVIDAEATREELGEQLKNALDAGAQFTVDADIVKFFNDATYGPKWAWLLDMVLGPTLNGQPGTDPNDADLSLVNQINAIKSNDPAFAISKNDWYNCYNLISFLADYFAQNDYSAFPSDSIVGIEWVNANHDYRTYFVFVLGLNDQVAAVDADLVNVGKKVTLPATAPKTGYEGYYVLTSDSSVHEVGEEYTVTDDDVQFLREYRLVNYTVTYELYGGTNNVNNPATFTYEDADIALLNPSRTGFTFDGWYTDTQFTNKVTKIANHTAEDITLYAKWTSDDYTITYNLNGGNNSANNPATFTIEDAVTYEDATKDYYTFAGWYKDALFANATTGFAAGVHEDQIVYAKWTPVAYTITYNKNDTDALPATLGNGTQNSYTIETATFNLVAATRTGYTFGGWYSDQELTTQVTSIELGSHGDVTLYAKWTPVTYTITYNLNGGTNDANNPASFTCETADITLAPATKDNYDFAGWYKENTFTTKVETIALGSTANVTLYAKFVDYTITYNLDGGTNSANNPQYFDSGDEFTFEPATKNGYTFAGWFKENTFVNEITGIAAGTNADVTVYAKFNINTYNITYNLDGGTNNANNPATFKVTDADIVFANPTKTGYTFGGWYKESTFTNAIDKVASGSYADVEVFAKFTLDTYTITYNLNGGTNAQSNPASYTYTSEDIALEDATKDGYQFDGWFKENTFENEVETIATGSTGNVTLYAKFTALPHEITFDYNDALTVDQVWSNFRNDAMTTATAVGGVRADYIASFLIHNGAAANYANEYYYDYLPLKAALSDADFRAKYTWLFDAIADVHATVSDNYTDSIKALSGTGVKLPNAIYVFCQEMKAYYYSVTRPNDTVLGFTDAQLQFEALYDWKTDPEGCKETFLEFSKTPDAVESLVTDSAIPANYTGIIRTGYTFQGWNTKADGTGDYVTTAPASDKTLYAIWLAN